MPFAVSRFLLQAWHPFPFVLSLVIVGIFASPWLLRSSGSVSAAGFCMIASAGIGFTVMSIFDGGIASPTVFGLVVIPILSIFFSTLRSGVIVALLTATSILLLTVATQLDFVFESSIAPDTQIYLTAGTAIALMCVLMSLAYLFVEWQAVARERLTAASIAKDEFLSGMSHELRTPLNSIIGFTEVLQREYLGSLNEEQKKNLSYINSSSEHLLQLVEDLFSLKALDNDNIKPDLEKVELNELLTFCITLMQPQCEAKEIKITLQMSQDSGSIEADPKLLKQILLNLLSNAVKFSPPSSTIKISVESTISRVRIEIQDSGPGIEDVHRDKIFDKFYKIDSSLSGKSDGAGLGLYISRALTELHKGNLYLASNEHPGACFVLKLRQSSSQQTP